MSRVGDEPGTDDMYSIVVPLPGVPELSLKLQTTRSPGCKRLLPNGFFFTYAKPYGRLSPLSGSTVEATVVSVLSIFKIDV